jgi:hypothetical protein
LPTAVGASLSDTNNSTSNNNGNAAAATATVGNANITTANSSTRKSQFVDEMDLTVGESVEVWGRTLRLVGCDGECFALVKYLMFMLVIVRLIQCQVLLLPLSTASSQHCQCCLPTVLLVVCLLLIDNN